jgi:hypothetical protein
MSPPTNCTNDIDCLGRRVCARNNTCSCISNGYVGDSCITPHPSLYIDGVVLFSVLIVYILMLIRLVIDLSRFWRFRLYIPHVASSFSTTVITTCGIVCGIIWISMDIFCTFDLGAPIIIYDLYKACPVSLGSSVCFSLCILFGYASLLNVISDWLSFMASAVGGGGGGGEGSWKERIPFYHRMIRISQSVFGFGLLTFLVSLRFDLLVLWMLPFTFGLIITYCLLGRTLVGILRVAQTTIGNKNPSSPLQQQRQQQPQQGDSQSSKRDVDNNNNVVQGLVRQMTSPADQSSNVNNNNSNNTLVIVDTTQQEQQQQQQPLPAAVSTVGDDPSFNNNGLLGNQLTSPNDANSTMSHIGANLGRQMTSPHDAMSHSTIGVGGHMPPGDASYYSDSKSSSVPTPATNNNNVIGGNMIRQMTTPLDASTNGDGGGGASSVQSSSPASPIRNNNKNVKRGRIPGRVVQISDGGASGGQNSSEAGSAMSMLLRSTMRRIWRTSVLVSVWIFFSILFAVSAFLLIFPRTSFQYEKGGWQRPGYWCFRASMICLTFVSLSMIWYVHSNNQLFITRMLQSIKHARVLNDAGVKEELRADSFMPSGDGTTLGRAEGSTVVAINTVDVDNTAVDNQLLNRWNNNSGNSSPQRVAHQQQGSYVGTITYVEESIA